MTTPWVIYGHRGNSPLLGAYLCENGIFVRSYLDGEIDVWFYPKEPAIQRMTRVGRYSVEDADCEAKIDAAVAKHLAKSPEEEE